MTVENEEAAAQVIEGELESIFEELLEEGYSPEEIEALMENEEFLEVLDEKISDLYKAAAKEIPNQGFREGERKRKIEDQSPEKRKAQRTDTWSASAEHAAQGTRFGQREKGQSGGLKHSDDRSDFEKSGGKGLPGKAIFDTSSSSHKPESRALTTTTGTRADYGALKKTDIAGRLGAFSHAVEAGKKKETIGTKLGDWQKKQQEKERFGGRLHTWQAAEKQKTAPHKQFTQRLGAAETERKEKASLLAQRHKERDTEGRAMIGKGLSAAGVKARHGDVARGMSRKDTGVVSTLAQRMAKGYRPNVLQRGRAKIGSSVFRAKSAFKDQWSQTGPKGPEKREVYTEPHAAKLAATNHVGTFQRMKNRAKEFGARLNQAGRHFGQLDPRLVHAGDFIDFSDPVVRTLMEKRRKKAPCPYNESASEGNVDPEKARIKLRANRAKKVGGVTMDAGKLDKYGNVDLEKARKRMNCKEEVELLIEKRKKKKKTKNFHPGGEKGKLHREIGVPEGEKIPEKKLEAAAHSKNPEIRRDAIRAKTMKKWKHTGPKKKHVKEGASAPVFDQMTLDAVKRAAMRQPLPSQPQTFKEAKTGGMLKSIREGKAGWGSFSDVTSEAAMKAISRLPEDQREPKILEIYSDMDAFKTLLGQRIY